ncbi:Lysophospholipase, alpha-beta hydrolase superfamily [Tistlia consotensis]|uniref:Lysophospholipase, alpha-beta hydrolase superfamily n=1 Tax=Tistlia consotensis USBA 355 TaxID=560819 RepID=A0A1Y6BZ99_9PROT|nr:alpha/beta hydrolase [Tistlia consotensis]SMF37081.1 Lysophospholipase, alpha-beta hydrolase superfamily [Tistlia consotensis USBA 355]SNR72401.1 Lysophospholipase, alpha-beta hydrolase superfamily [Tistlia consotensis]
MLATDIAAPTGRPGETLHLRRVDGGGGGDGRPPVLFLHGSTVPASVAFASRFDGLSFLELAAAQGLDAWSLDFRGFGRSFRPDGSTGPVTSTGDAVSDVEASVAHILAETGATQLDLVGWSWGATVAGSFAAGRSPRLRRLVLIAPQWLRDTPSPLLKDPAVLESGYRAVVPEAVAARWIGGLPEQLADQVTRNGWDRILAAALAEEASGAGLAPNGPLREIHRNWSGGLPVYAPRLIEVPVRVLVGSDDRETPPPTVRGLFAELVRHPDAQLLEISGASHFVPLEPKREQVVHFIAGFLG